MNVEKWRDLVLLAPGESLVYLRMRNSGFMSEEDIEEYDVVDAEGVKVGFVTVTDHTAVKGFRRTITVNQRNSENKVILNVSYDL